MAERTYHLTETELLELIEGLESACDMMEPYYAQCDADVPLRALVDKYKAMLPKEELKVDRYECTVCHKSFGSIDAVVQHSSVKHPHEFGTKSQRKALRRLFLAQTSA